MRHKYRYWHRLSRVFVVFAVLAVVCGIPAAVSATCTSNQQSCSSSYGVGETHFGSGGQVCIPGTNGSTHYCADMSAGDLSVGGTSSTDYQNHTGSGLTTHREEYIEVDVNNAPFTFTDPLSRTCTSVTTADFSVKTYLADGYVVQTEGNPPTSAEPNPHTFATNTTPTVPNVGQEQFGINLVANSGNMPNDCQAPPNSLGADPLQVPDSTYSFGAAAGSAQNPSNSDAYDQTGKFMYRNGDVIAYSDSSSGETDYTMSLIYNIDNLTPGGVYVFSDSIVATSTY
jgi:hypothetical protein